MYNQACWGKPAIPALPLETKVGRAGAGSQSHSDTQVRGQLFSKEKGKEKEKNGVMRIGLNREKKQ